MAWGPRTLDKGGLGSKVPHEPGDCSFVAQVFMHMPLRAEYLRRSPSGMRVKTYATGAERRQVGCVAAADSAERSKGKRFGKARGPPVKARGAGASLACSWAARRIGLGGKFLQ